MNVFVWLMILVAFLVIEGLTAGLMTIWFAGGALVAALAAFLGATLVPQLLLFIGVSVVLLVFTRPLAIKHRKNDTTSTNVDSLIGTTAVVTEDIDNLAQGRSKILGVGIGFLHAVDHFLEGIDL